VLKKAKKILTKLVEMILMVNLAKEMLRQKVKIKAQVRIKSIKKMLKK